MAISTSAADEVKKQIAVNTATLPLRERWDNDWALIRLTSALYKIPEEEGEWDNVVTNRAPAEFYKITDYLAYARRKLWIPIQSEDKKGRKELSQTELLANGCIYLADNLETGLPYQQKSQDALSFFRVARGWSASRFLLREEEGKLKPDTAFWDPRNTYWMTGRQRLVWVCYERFATKEEIQDEYKGWNGTVDHNNMASIKDVWSINLDTDERTEGGLKPGDAQEAVIIGNEYVREPKKIGLDYLPIRINAGRTTPLIRDALHKDNIVMVGESLLASTRTMLPIESRLMSYELTRAGQLSKAPMVIKFDSNQDPIPPGYELDPSVKGRTIFLDAAKGQEFSERLIPPEGSNIVNMIGMVQTMLMIGGLTSLTHGMGPYPDTAQGTDIIAHKDLEKMNPFKLGIESDYVWWAEEIVRQYKNGDFDDYEIEGLDGANNPFKAKIKSDKIDTNWKFKCELIPDLLRDKAANLNWVTSAIKSGLISTETARDQAQIVIDTDLESQKVAREQARSVLNIGPVEAVLAMVDDHIKSPTPQSRFILQYAMQKLVETMGGGEQAQPGASAETASTGQGDSAVAVPDNVRQAAEAQQIAAQQGPVQTRL